MIKLANFSGLSILEVVLTLALVSLLIAMSVPNFYVGYDHAKMFTLMDHLLQELYLARSEAAMRKEKITLWAQNSDWSAGQLIKDSQERVIHKFPALPRKYRLRFKGCLAINDRITFLPNGFTQGQRGSFYLEGTYKKVRIILQQSGRVRVEDF